MKKKFPWMKNCNKTPNDYFLLLEQRREELLQEQHAISEVNEDHIIEWIKLQEERDRVFRQIFEDTVLLQLNRAILSAYNHINALLLHSSSLRHKYLPSSLQSDLIRCIDGLKKLINRQKDAKLAKINITDLDSIPSPNIDQDDKKIDSIISSTPDDSTATSGPYDRRSFYYADDSFATDVVALATFDPRLTDTAIDGQSSGAISPVPGHRLTFDPPLAKIILGQSSDKASAAPGHWMTSDPCLPLTVLSGEPFVVPEPKLPVNRSHSSEPLLTNQQDDQDGDDETLVGGSFPDLTESCSLSTVYDTCSEGLCSTMSTCSFASDHSQRRVAQSVPLPNYSVGLNIFSAGCPQIGLASLAPSSSSLPKLPVAQRAQDALNSSID